jgi:hypothetical protein
MHEYVWFFSCAPHLFLNEGELPTNLSPVKIYCYDGVDVMSMGTTGWETRNCHAHQFQYRFTDIVMTAEFLLY